MHQHKKHCCIYCIEPLWQRKKKNKNNLYLHRMVELSRVVYQEPDIPLSPKRSDVITAKKTVLNGEVVNGGPLPNPPHHTPRSSFDFQNKYQGEPATSNFIKGIDTRWSSCTSFYNKYQCKHIPLALFRISYKNVIFNFIKSNFKQPISCKISFLSFLFAVKTPPKHYYDSFMYL